MSDINNEPRRRHSRLPVSLEVQYRTQGSFLVSYTFNLSKGGLFLETQDSLPIGTALTVRLIIPGAEKPIETDARVVWVRETNPSQNLPPGLGLQFDSLESQMGVLIDRLVGSFSGVKILALAGDTASLDRLSRYLKSILNCDVILATASDTVAAGFASKIDLVLVDLDSSGQEGLMTIRMARKMARHTIPVVTLTRSDQIKTRALQEGVAAVLENPPVYEELRLRVLEVLGMPFQKK